MHYTFTAKFSSILHDSIQLRHFGTTVSLKRMWKTESKAAVSSSDIQYRHSKIPISLNVSLTLKRVAKQWRLWARVKRCEDESVKRTENLGIMHKAGSRLLWMGGGKEKKKKKNFSRLSPASRLWSLRPPWLKCSFIILFYFFLFFSKYSEIFKILFSLS